MNLTELQLKARVRTPWQALDLSMKMARRWYWPLMLAWLLPALAVYLLLSPFLYDSPLWMLTIIWWLKPLLDRLPLLLLSRYIFNDAVRHWFNRHTLLDLYRFDALSALTVRRFNIQRSFNLPVTVLERQTGRQRKRRCDILRHWSGAAGGWLTVVMLHLEMLLPLGIALPLFVWIDGYVDIDLFALMVDEHLGLVYVQSLSMLLSMALIAPFYIAGGFSLYLNRRITMEAWDLELLFRQSVRKREPKSGVTPLMSALLVMLALALVAPFSASPVQAQEQETELTSQQYEARDQIRTILETPPFVIEDHVSHWQWQGGTDPDVENATLTEWLVDLMGGDHDVDLSLLFQVAEVLIWIGVGLVVALVLKKLIAHLNSSHFSQLAAPRPAPSPHIMMGLAISADSFPEDIDTRIHEAFARGEDRQAVSLMYRHVLYLLIHQHQVSVESWYTELECARAVKQSPKLRLEGRFDELTQYWLRLAYAHQPPPQKQVLSVYQALKQVLAP